METISNSIPLRNELCDKIGYKFNNYEYLTVAMTHSSYANENKKMKYNERMEFLGDSVLSLAISEYIYNLEKKLREGDLTKIRAAVVCEEALSDVARKINLSKYIMVGKGEEVTGGRFRNSTLADAFEALIAAIYLDGGFEPAKKFVLSNLSEIIARVLRGEVFRDFKSKLQESIQCQFQVTIKYRTLHEEGPDHCKTFTVAVFCEGVKLGTGVGHNKKEAEQAAAKMACEFIKNKGIAHLGELIHAK